MVDLNKPLMVVDDYSVYPARVVCKDMVFARRTVALILYLDERAMFGPEEFIGKYDEKDGEFFTKVEGRLMNVPSEGFEAFKKTFDDAVLVRKAWEILECDEDTGCLQDGLDLAPELHEALVEKLIAEPIPVLSDEAAAWLKSNLNPALFASYENSAARQTWTS